MELQIDENGINSFENGDKPYGNNKQQVKTEEKQGNCYCGKERNLNILELLCVTCNRWFHESCIGYQLGKLIPFATNYVFVCKNCSPTGLESFRKGQATIPQMCTTAIANLQQAAAKEAKYRHMFSKDMEIIPFIEQYWEAMTTMPRRVTQSWYSTVQKTLVKDIHTIFSYEETADKGQMYGLVSLDLTLIKPNYDAMVKGGTLRINDDGYAQEQVANMMRNFKIGNKFYFQPEEYLLPSQIRSFFTRLNAGKLCAAPSNKQQKLDDVLIEKELIEFLVVTGELIL